MKTQTLNKSLIAASLATLLVLGSANALEAPEQQADRSYVDPITGEVKQASKLLSEMSDTEKALLSNEEYQALKELEAKLYETTDKAVIDGAVNAADE